MINTVSISLSQYSLHSPCSANLNQRAIASLPSPVRPKHIRTITTSPNFNDKDNTASSPDLRHSHLGCGDSDVAGLTHLDHKGHAHMVNVGSKSPSSREARASGSISLSPRAFQLISDPIAEGRHSKGDVLGVARVAGIMAAKKTSEFIPLCHPISLTHVAVDFDLCENTGKVMAYACAKCEGVTGVEMEALIAVTTALLTIYDMTKSVGKDHVISNVQLDSKSGGTSGNYSRTL